MFSTLHTRNASQGIDDLILNFGPIFIRAEALLAEPLTALDELNQSKRKAIALNQAFVQWQEAQIEDVKPWTVGHVSQGRAPSKAEVGYWPGKVDAYFDLYVAGVWNTACIFRLLLLDMIVRLSKVLNENDSHISEQHAALRLVEDIFASIPFHLAEDLQVFLCNTQDENAAARSIRPGRPVGGLLLLHPLCIASKLSIVPPRLQDYTRDCLDWIATNMGIGQASLLTKVRKTYPVKSRVLWVSALEKDPWLILYHIPCRISMFINSIFMKTILPTGG